MLRCLKYTGMIIVLMVAHVFAQQKWVPFLEQNETKPKAIVQQSNNSIVTFSVQVNGMVSDDKEHEGTKYQRLSIPEGIRFSKEGSPEVPMVTQLIAIPDCDDVILSVAPSGEQELSDYNLYPAPGFEEKKWPDGSHSMEEVFRKDESIYATNDYYPYKCGEVIETGYVRSQKVARIALYPIRFNPVQKKIKAFTNFQINLSFVNAKSPVNNELGIFRHMMHNAALNYELDGIDASTKSTGLIQGNQLSKTGMVMNGSVNRVTNLNLLTAGTNSLPCDYLVITHSSLFNSTSLTNLANQRMNRNGFDVVIVKADTDIYSNPKYPSTTTTRHISIRDFIKDVYTNGKANHTFDGKLGYIVLVGDAYFDNTTEMLPAAYPSRYEDLDMGGDYYYACTGGDSDDLMDVMYGRLSVGNETQLSNVVNKIINYELNSSSVWNDEITFIGGSYDRFEYSDPKIQTMTNSLPQPISKKHYAYMALTGSTTAVTQASPIYPQTFSNSDYHNSSLLCGAVELNDWFYDNSNAGINHGIHTFIYEGHGRPGALRANEGDRCLFRVDQIQSRLSNSFYPFMILNTCDAGWFDAQSADLGSVDCIAEAAVNIANEGAIACLASTRVSDAKAFGLVDGYIIDDLYNKSFYILGDAVMDSKLRLPGTNIPLGIQGLQYRRQYNLYGDPALNLFPNRVANKLSQNVTWSGTHTITADLIVPSGVTLTIQPGTKINFIGYFGIYVYPGGKIIAEGTSTNGILFTRQSHIPGSWKYVQVQDGNSIFKYCTFEYGVYGLYLYYAYSGNTTLIQYDTLRNNSECGLRLWRSKADVKSCDIRNNGEYGVYCYNNSITAVRSSQKSVVVTNN